MSHLFAARLIGALFILSTASYMTASDLITSVFLLPNYLEQTYLHKNALTLAALLEFVNSAAVVGIAIVIYPIIKPLSERIALTYLSFRVIEAVMLLIGAAALLSMINISKELAESSAASLTHFQTIADMLKAERYFNFQLGMIPLAMCGVMLCVVFYQYRLVPRALSALGLVGYCLLFIKVTADFFALKIGGGFLYIPGALFELFLPIWLFFKGFSLPETTQVQ